MSDTQAREFSERVIRALAAVAAINLERIQYGLPSEESHILGFKLFTSIQALSYLEELEDSASKRANQNAIVSYIGTLLDLEEVALEPYNLTYRPTKGSARPIALAVNDGLLNVGTMMALLKTGSSVYIRQPLKLSPYPVAENTNQC